MSKAIIITIAVAVVCLAGGFVGGMQYQKSKGSRVNNQRMMFGDFQNLTQEQRDQARLQFGGGGLFAGARNGVRVNNGGFVAGEIITKDQNSITVKLQEGLLGSTGAGSKLVLFATSTIIMKSSTGSVEDLKVGEQVVTNGTANSDGSMTAQNIQIRPTLPLNNPQQAH